MSDSPTVIKIPARAVVDGADGSRPPASMTRGILLRRLAYIMLFRVILFTLILGGTVIVNLAWGTPEDLGGPYVTFLFVFITAIYILNIIYAALLRWFRRISTLAIIQLGVDLITSAILVYFTGGADSGFVLFFLLTPIAAAVTLDRRSAVAAAIIGALLFAGVAAMGYFRWFSLLPGQHPFVISPDSLARSLLVNGTAIIAVAILAGYLAEQLRFAAKKAEVQQAHIDDLATLNTDIIRCLTSGLITVNDDGTILSINQAAGEILNLPQHLAGGKKLRDLAPELADTVARSDEIRRTEVSLSRGRQPLLLGISVSPLTDHLNQTRGRIINFQDLTGIRQMEAMFKRSEHLSSLGRVAAGVAHEIRNPLASISGSLQLLQGEELNPENVKLMRIALREIERLNSLITSFLAYARPRPPLLVMVDLGKAIHDLVNEIAELATSEEEMPRIVVEAQEGSWVKADRDQLRGVLWNLVRNAWEAGEHDSIGIRVEQRDRWVVMEVQDRASGIPDDEQGRAFEPFFTTKDSGTGLGLSTVHQTIQQHNGELDINSAVGEGTTIIILLPLQDPGDRGS